MSLPLGHKSAAPRLITEANWNEIEFIIRISPRNVATYPFQSLGWQSGAITRDMKISETGVKVAVWAAKTYSFHCNSIGMWNSVVGWDVEDIEFRRRFPSLEPKQSDLIC